MNLLERHSLMNAEQITEKQVWDSREISDIPRVLDAQIRHDIPGMEVAFVWGDPYYWGNKLDFQQGYDNPYGAFGTCGENAVSNLCKLAGMNVIEPEVVKYAIENNLCEKYDPVIHGGATTISNQIALLEHYGLQAHCEFAAETATPARLAAAVEGGHGVMLSLNSGVLRDQPWRMHNKDGKITANHSVCLTGTVRDTLHNLKGFFLCDSSGQTPDSGRTFVPIDRFNQCYSKVDDAFSVITDRPVRHSIKEAPASGW